MDPISGVIAGNKIPIGQWTKSVSDTIVDLFGTVLRALSGGLGAGLDTIVDALLWLPPKIGISGFRPASHVK